MQWCNILYGFRGQTQRSCRNQTFLHLVSKRLSLNISFPIYHNFLTLEIHYPSQFFREKEQKAKYQNQEENGTPRHRGVYFLVETEHGPSLVAPLSRGGDASEEFLRGPREGPGSSTRSHRIAQARDSKKEMKALITNAEPIFGGERYHHLFPRNTIHRQRQLICLTW